MNRPRRSPGQEMVDGTPVPVDGRPDFVWPSWRKALTDAQEGK